VVNLLQALAREQGRPILMVTHDTRVLDIADRILELQDGRLASHSAGASNQPGPVFQERP
jgi:putative ABC transport system ATP-binding protein